VALTNPDYPFEYDELTQGFDRDGQQVVSHHYGRDRANNPTVDTPTRSYYGADGKLRAVQRHVQFPGSAKGTWEEYRYDPLGRRVMVIARPGGTRPPGCDTLRLQYCAALCSVSSSGDCASKVTTVVWDGNQVVREERRPYPGDPSTSPYYGTIEYVHGPQLDKPLATLDGTVSGGVRVLNPNWRGLFESSVTAAGVGADCSLIVGSCSRIAWPAGQAVYQRPLPMEAGGMGSVPIAWAGTLLTDGQDGTGQLYRRNRYYDSDAGRFTQEDPIGLAGGMNLYGFAEGDPVNYSDPLGLCPVCDIADIGFFLYSASKTIANPSRQNLRNAALDAAGLLPLIPSAGLVRRAGQLLGAASDAATPTARVIGSYGETGVYLQVGEAIGAKTLNIPMDTWSKMSKAEQWAANQRFLDRGISGGAEFVLSTHPSDIRAGTALAREVSYLLSKGYKWSSNGLSLIPK
jgi:RHS repeat-associated protein